MHRTLAIQARGRIFWAGLLAGLAACTAPAPRVHQPSSTAENRPAPFATLDAPSPSARNIPVPGQSIVVAGTRVQIGAPVVLWTQPGGYDAYSRALAFPSTPPADPPTGLRYLPGRECAPEKTLQQLRECVDQFVLHYDVCGTSRVCFKVLHDQRKLSVHFLLDLDGTIYQTLDVAETAWHATKSNGRSVGVEIANIGAYPPGQSSALDEWYTSDELGPRVRIPVRLGEPGIRTQDFVARPSQPQRVRGTIQDQELEMWDLTPAQYESLARLSAGLHRALPKIRLEAPREVPGVSSSAVSTRALSQEAWEAFSGILGHYHVQDEKYDPGPAFDWDRLLRRARELASRMPTPAAP